MAWPEILICCLRQSEAVTRRHPQLQRDQVLARDFFADRCSTWMREFTSMK